MFLLRRAIPCRCGHFLKLMVYLNDAAILLKRRKAHCDLLAKKLFRCNAEMSCVAIALHDLIVAFAADVSNNLNRRVSGHAGITRVPSRKYSTGQKGTDDLNNILRSSR